MPDFESKLDEHNPPHRLDDDGLLEAIASLTNLKDDANQDAIDASAARQRDEQEHQRRQQQPQPDHQAASSDSRGIHSLPTEILAEIYKLLIVEDQVNNPDTDGRRSDASSTRQQLLDLCLASKRLAEVARHELYSTASFYAPPRTIATSRRAQPGGDDEEAARLSARGQRSLVLFLRSLLENASLRPFVKHLDCLVSLHRWVDPGTPGEPHPNGQLVHGFWATVYRDVRVQHQPDLDILELAGLIKTTPPWQRRGSGSRDGLPFTQLPVMGPYVGGRVYVALLCLCPQLRSTSFTAPVQEASVTPFKSHPGSLADSYQELSGILDRALSNGDIGPSLLRNLEKVAVGRQSVVSRGSWGESRTASRIGCDLLVRLARLPSVRTVELDRLRMCLPQDLDVDGVESLRVGGRFTSADLVNIFSSPTLKRLHLRVYGKKGMGLAQDADMGVLGRALPQAAASLVSLDIGLVEMSSPWLYRPGKGPHREASSTLRWLVGDGDATGQIRCLPSLRNLRELHVDAALLLGDGFYPPPPNVGRMLPAGLERLCIREAFGVHPCRGTLDDFWKVSDESYRYWMQSFLFRFAAVCPSQLKSLREVSFVRSPDPDSPEWDLGPVSNAFRDVNVKFI